MADKKEELTKKQKTQKKAKSNLEPCENAHTMETSRPDKDEEACDEGVK
jgi:hypothetical protein